MQFVFFKTASMLVGRKKCPAAFTGVHSCQSSIILSFLIGIILREKKLLTAWVLDTQLHFCLLFLVAMHFTCSFCSEHSWHGLTKLLTWSIKCWGWKENTVLTIIFFYTGLQILPWCYWKQQIWMVLGLSRWRRQLYVSPCPPSRLCIKKRQKEGRKTRWNFIRRSNRERGKVVRQVPFGGSCFCYFEETRKKIR